MWIRILSLARRLTIAVDKRFTAIKRLDTASVLEFSSESQL
jgi:hypothetical protein